MLNSGEKGVPDESDRFLMDPAAFVLEYSKNWSQPSHIVLYDSEEQKLRNYLISLDYREVLILIRQYLFLSSIFGSNNWTKFIEYKFLRFH